MNQENHVDKTDIIEQEIEVVETEGEVTPPELDEKGPKDIFDLTKEDIAKVAGEEAVAAKEALQAAASQDTTVAINQEMVEAVSADEDLRKVAQKSLQEYISGTCIPKELLPTIVEWLEITGLSGVYLDPTDSIGAWWGAQEAKKMGYTINFGKSCCIPSHWCPKGDDWKVAQATAKMNLVKDWQLMVENGALVKIEG